MYEILLKTWYQDEPKKYYIECYNNMGVSSIEKATKYLSNNINDILEGFPVEEIKIKFNLNHGTKL